MARVVTLTFNPFQENTYLVIADNNSCAIFDPGCSNSSEKESLAGYIDTHGLKPVWLINTHCHVDHIFGNAFIAQKYGLQLAIHKGELPVLEAAPVSAQIFGIPFDPADSVEPGIWLEVGQHIRFGDVDLEIRFTPGHSPASISFYDREHKFLIAGDVLFKDSIGRTDLPGGDFDTLISSIRSEILTLDDDVVVYPGHGPATSVGAERRSNPFLQEG